MAKQQHIIAVKGMTITGKVARIGEDVTCWENSTGQFAAWSDIENMFVQTSKGITKLEPHASIQNLWVGKTDGGTKMHMSLKKVVGKIIYWL